MLVVSRSLQPVLRLHNAFMSYNLYRELSKCYIGEEGARHRGALMTILLCSVSKLWNRHYDKHFLQTYDLLLCNAVWT